MNLKEKTNYANEKIQKLILDILTGEQLVAIALHSEGITETDFFNMRLELPISNATLIKIANHLRDLWRK
jgi:hypothetical protein